MSESDPVLQNMECDQPGDSATNKDSVDCANPVDSSANHDPLKKTEAGDKESVEKVPIDSNDVSDSKSVASTDADGALSKNEGTPAWDHSDRKVLLQGVHKYMDVKRARKEMHDLVKTINKSIESSLEIDKVKKPPKDSWLTITFTQVDMVQPFIDYVNSHDLKSKQGRKLFGKKVESNETINKKRRNDGDDDDRSNKRPTRTILKAESRRPVTEEEIKEKICPLWNLSHEEQLGRKVKEMIKKSSLKIVQEIKSKFRTLEKEKRQTIRFYDWFNKKGSIRVEDVVPVPTPIRNKVEFTFGYRYLFDESSGEQTTSSEEIPKVPAVGFMVLGWAGGVSRPHCCPNIGSEFCALSDLVDTFLKDSPLPPYDSSVHKGFWRFLTIRASRRTRQCMVIITHSPSSGGRGEDADWSAHVDKEKQRLLEMLKAAELAIPDQDPIRVTSIYFQEFAGLSSPKPDDPVQLAYGKPTLEEQLGKCTFHISPGAFFQVNTVGAEILYKIVVDKVREVSEDPKNTLLFDVCCGTGTIGLTCMKEGVVGKVVGVDISEPAIEDAKKNAEVNGYKNDDDQDGVSTTRFVASRAEHVMNKEISNIRNASKINFVAVVDPAREGLHAEVIRALRGNEKIKRIVYVSCNPTGSLIKDAGLLCSPPTKKYSGTPFRVESAKPVDMFPLTAHCEMVITFDRITDDDKVEPDVGAIPVGKQGDTAGDSNVDLKSDS